MKNRDRRRVLVTGGAGFIGAHLTGRLLDLGHEVTVVDDLSSASSGRLPVHPRLRFLRKDVLKLTDADLRSVPDAVVHLAACPSVDFSWERPIESHARNVTTTVHLAETCRRRGIGRIVFASSAAVYGPRAGRVRESSDKSPISPYGEQKLFSERCLELHARAGAFTAVVLRLFNVYGHGVGDRRGSGVIARFFEDLSSGRPLTVHGDGSQTRDFVHVEDVVEAFVRALEVRLGPDPFLACNVASGRACSVRSILEELGKRFPDRPIRVRRLARRPGDIPHSLADVRRARRRLRFACRHDLDSGLSRMLEHSLRAAEEAA